MPLVLETQHGRIDVEWYIGESVRDALRRSGVPLTAVWTYAMEGDDRRVFISTSTIRSADDHLMVHARATRNIDLPYLRSNEAAADRDPTIGTPEAAVTEWRLPDRSRGAYGAVVEPFTQQECFEYVKRSVEDTVAAWPPSVERRVLLGTSGGGDSNVLLSALVACLGREAVVPAMMLGIPDWDSQLDAAQTMCASQGLRLRVISAEAVARYAGIASVSEAIDLFAQFFPDADREILGTWLLRKVLGGFADENGVPVVATGTNREDYVAESFACVARGLSPMTAPFRRIGERWWVFPLWAVPKKIGDGAYPLLSLQNYEARAPSFSHGRGVFYSMAYVLEDAVCGSTLDLARGFARMGAAAAPALAYDDDLGDLVVAGTVDDDLRRRWKKFLEATARD